MEASIVRRMAHLGRIELDDRELERIARDLTSIVRYFDKLQELDTAEVEPLVHPVPRTDVLAEDVVEPSLGVEATLRNAPRHDGVYFRVPRILGST